MNMHEIERLNAQQVIAGFKAIEATYECRVLFIRGDSVIKLAGSRGAVIWEVSGLAGRSRAEIKEIVASAIKRIGIKKKDTAAQERVIGTAYMDKMKAVVADAPKEEIQKADEVIRKVKANRNAPHQYRFNLPQAS